MEPSVVTLREILRYSVAGAFPSDALRQISEVKTRSVTTDLQLSEARHESVLRARRTFASLCACIVSAALRHSIHVPDAKGKVRDSQHRSAAWVLIGEATVSTANFLQDLAKVVSLAKACSSIVDPEETKANTRIINLEI
jgi:hypothetical protein